MTTSDFSGVEAKKFPKNEWFLVNHGWEGLCILMTHVQGLQVHSQLLASKHRIAEVGRDPWRPSVKLLINKKSKYYFVVDYKISKSTHTRIIQKESKSKLYVTYSSPLTRAQKSYFTIRIFLIIISLCKSLRKWTESITQVLTVGSYAVSSSRSQFQPY